MGKKAPRASIIIPHWNGLPHLDGCLMALRQQTSRDFETILVDNGSTDGSQTYVKGRYPEVRLLELGENRGFTGACNAGYASAKGEIVILLNNDTEAHPDWLAEILAGFDRHPQAGIVASKLLLFGRRDTLHAAGDTYSVAGLPGNRGVWQPDSDRYNQEERVFSACGAAAAYRRTMLTQIGFLDDGFFFSCEDVDMGWRANLTGWEVWYLPTAVVYHKLKATGGSVTGSYYDGRNFLFLLYKNYPTSLWRRYWRQIVGTQLTISREALRHWRGAAARARLRGQLAGVWGAPKMWPQRRRLQEARQISDEALLALLQASEPQ